MKPVAAAFVILGTALTARAQPPRESASTAVLQVRPISGRVLADDTGNPIANARVALTSSVPRSPVLTDRDGRFTVNAPPGRYTLVVSKTGYARQERAGATTDDAVDVRLAHAAAMSGRVVDAHGDPVLNARIVAEPAALATGAPVPGAAASVTDDRGEYRIGSLAADTFKVAVITQGQPTRRQMPGGGVAMIPSTIKTYYPDAAAPETAEAIRLKPGEDRPSIDFVVANGQPGMEQMMVMMTPLGFAPLRRFHRSGRRPSFAGASSPPMHAPFPARRCGSCR